jgi:glycosyltransferase involved in cell wall biosynthesis
MRVLMLTQSYAPIVGGIERMVEAMSAELAARGHDVAVATLRQPQSEPIGSEEVSVFPLGTSVHSLPGLRLDEERRHAPPGPDPRTTRELRRMIRSFRPDVVHAHDWLIHSYLPLDRRSSVGLVLSMHDYGLTCATKRFMHKGSVCGGPGPVKCVLCACEVYESVAKGGTAAVGTRLFEGHVRNHVDVLLPVSTAVRDLCRLGPEDVHRVIPNFVPDQPSPLRDGPELAQLPKEPFILYFGDVSEEKGVHHLVASYHDLDAPPPLVLIGRRVPGEVEDTAGGLALGRMPHRLVLEALRRSLFTVAPSIWSDPFPLVALEAAAAGKPTIASRIGGLQDSVVDGETGILIPPGDRPALVKAMRRLIDDAESRERMGAAAAARQAELFTPDTVVPQYEQAYELALEQRELRRHAGAD